MSGLEHLPVRDSNPKERRKSRRVPVMLPLELTWTSADGVRVRTRGVSVNTSSKGLLVETATPIPKSAEVEIRHPRTRLSAVAYVVRQARGRNGAIRLAVQITRGRMFLAFLALVCLMLSFLPPLRAADRQIGPTEIALVAMIEAPDDKEMADLTARQTPTGATEASLSTIPASSSPPEPAASPPVVVESSMTMDVSRSLRGGLESRSAAARHLAQVGVRVDSRSLGWHGGSIYLGLQEHAGRPGSLLVGDAQGFSNIDAPRRTEVAEFWFEQVLAGGKLRVKAGKVDANKEFAFVENAADFLNSSMGYSPTILVMPTYPNARLGFNAFYVPSEHFYAGLGVYDAEGAGYMPIGEVGTRWKAAKSQLPGRLGVGFWHYSGNLDRFLGGVKPGTSGFFVVCDQKLWRERPEASEDPQGIGVFFQFGSADADVSEITRHFGGGVEWTGPLPGRDADAIGFGATHVKFTTHPGDGFEKPSELALETFYKIQLAPWLSIAPDLQYICTPGGASTPGHALVGTVRVTVDFSSVTDRFRGAGVKALHRGSARLGLRSSMDQNHRGGFNSLLPQGRCRESMARRAT